MVLLLLSLRPMVQGTGWVVERAWDINCVEIWTRRPRCADRWDRNAIVGTGNSAQLGTMSITAYKAENREK